MFARIMIAILAGLSSGMITGLIPGIHVNLISLVVFGFVPFLKEYLSYTEISCFIISMAITHSFLDSIPSIFLGAPDDANILTVLPGHKLLLEGRGIEAVKLTLIGSYLSLILSIILVPLIIPAISNIYEVIQDKIGYILLIIVSYLIFKDRNWIKNLFIFMTSGYLGIVVLNMKTLENPLFPMLTGMFGLSILIESLRTDSSIPEQQDSEEHIPLKKTTKTIFLSTGAGFFASFLPGLGSSQSAIIATRFLRRPSKEIFLILVGGINTVNMSLSIITLSVLEKARNGAIVIVSKMIENLDMTTTTTFLLVCLISGSISVFLGMKISRIFSKVITKIDYDKLIKSIIILLVSMTMILSGYRGILILITSTSLGMLAQRLNVGKNHCLGCLLIPTITYFLL